MEYLKSSNLVKDQEVQKAIKENSINTRQPTIKAVKCKRAFCGSNLVEGKCPKCENLTFAEFSKKLDKKRSGSVYLSGKHLFRKVNNEINLLNEKLFYSLFISGQLNY